jgi:NADH:ubiquinone oxidoreductase subunit H
MISALFHPYVGALGLVLVKIVCLLVAIAYFTIAERKILAAIQRRKGPNTVGIFGLLQPAADGLKLIAKEMIIPSHANSRIFVVAPLVVLTLSLLTWSIIPFGIYDHSEVATSQNLLHATRLGTYEDLVAAVLALGTVAGKVCAVVPDPALVVVSVAVSAVVYVSYCFIDYKFLRPTRMSQGQARMDGLQLGHETTVEKAARLVESDKILSAQEAAERARILADKERIIREAAELLKWQHDMLTTLSYCATAVCFLLFVGVLVRCYKHFRTDEKPSLDKKAATLLILTSPLTPFFELYNLLQVSPILLSIIQELTLVADCVTKLVSSAITAGLCWSFLLLLFVAPLFKLCWKYLVSKFSSTGRRVLPLLMSPSYSDFHLLIESNNVGDNQYGLLIVLAISSLSVYGLILSGWSSNSKYAFLGALRSAAQMISYEVAISLVILPLIAMAGALNFARLVFAQTLTSWNVTPLLQPSVIFFISMIAETNRTPFDLPEAEAELVAGYNIEYSSIIFAMFFLAEYGNMSMMSLLKSLLFLGGGGDSVVEHVPQSSVLTLKGLFFCYMFVLVRAAYPRYRYDQLMNIGWKVFLPTSTGFLVYAVGMLVAFNASPTIQEFRTAAYSE